ncbi:PREDICTED: cyclin-dependent kinase 2-associated protein 1-like [Chrysochloris asiatica]|uniref:Cyclin-dependent kinase 2-associated protein 1-like n=1 Tax=Chrysochloris asiatica TaxID=185453 RepID=A0A9B0TUW2_CHRAS|nr:PREDICTED: cyclin-dependent kinase 2-associated protein 1-like [Chrysochloris asiatica]
MLVYPISKLYPTSNEDPERFAPFTSLRLAWQVQGPAASPTRCPRPHRTSSQYRRLLSDKGPPSLGYTQGTSNSQALQGKDSEPLAIEEELGRDQTTFSWSKSAVERLNRGIIHARELVQECLTEMEGNA